MDLAEGRSPTVVITLQPIGRGEGLARPRWPWVIGKRHCKIGMNSAWPASCKIGGNLPWTGKGYTERLPLPSCAPQPLTVWLLHAHRPQPLALYPYRGRGGLDRGLAGSVIPTAGRGGEQVLWLGAEACYRIAVPRLPPQPSHCPHSLCVGTGMAFFCPPQ